MAKKAEEPAELGLSLVTVRRTLAVIEMLADSDTGMSLSDIARRLDVNKNIALRILMTLEEENYLYRHAESKFYFVGFKVSNLGLRVLSRNRLLGQCQPVLRQLADTCGELVLFSVLDHGQPRWVMAAVGRRQRLQIDPVTPMAPHATATGKAWLSTLPDAQVAQIVEGKLEPLTPFTVTTLEALLAQLAEIRRTGLALSNQENEAGIAAIATPIWAGADAAEAGARRCVGFVSITAPVSRATPEDFRRFGGLVRDCAARLGDAWPLPEADSFAPSQNLMPHGLIL
ncbi:IclR family transcriptional regulator [Roseomonas frigidaquae]|uniref:IclR family transcriptional regulator n=1 Tax=Falsiroseomonas frigidaquae TaxID=487318 RepID=A0ABX1ESM7_9PROT|nr:IclR family transcriptional regulator [Falsiroseomonas frigidaquae]NKE43143.1 IclR family transcriptional regulator [Falsiroseomonas frigidaquae]